jgi:hypothetical protein
MPGPLKSRAIGQWPHDHERFLARILLAPPKGPLQSTLFGSRIDARSIARLPFRSARGEISVSSHCKIAKKVATIDPFKV